MFLTTKAVVYEIPEKKEETKTPEIPEEY